MDLVLIMEKVSYYECDSYFEISSEDGAIDCQIWWNSVESENVNCTKEEAKVYAESICDFLNYAYGNTKDFDDVSYYKERLEMGLSKEKEELSALLNMLDRVENTHKLNKLSRKQYLKLVTNDPII